MISARFSKDYGKGEIRLTVNGHAGQDEYGKDIVCASASILVYTLAETITRAYEDGTLKRRPYIALKGGDAVISCSAGDGRTMREMTRIYTVIENGFSLIAEKYPQYAEIIKFGRPGRD